MPHERQVSGLFGSGRNVLLAGELVGIGGARHGWTGQRKFLAFRHLRSGLQRRWLGHARCLLVPSQTPETSSLVAMEALACGTPVIAFRAGALAEIVEHGRTGFLVDSTEQMADAILRADSIDPIECRRVAVDRFSADTMTARYLARYQRMVAARRSARSRQDLGVEAVTSLAGLARVRAEWTELWRRASGSSNLRCRLPVS